MWWCSENVEIDARTRSHSVILFPYWDSIFSSPKTQIEHKQHAFAIPFAHLIWMVAWNNDVRQKAGRGDEEKKKYIEKWMKDSKKLSTNEKYEYKTKWMKGNFLMEKFVDEVNTRWNWSNDFRAVILILLTRSLTHGVCSKFESKSQVVYYYLS